MLLAAGNRIASLHGLSNLGMLECLDLKCNYVERLAEAGGEGRVDAMYEAGRLAYQATKVDEAAPLLARSTRQNQWQKRWSTGSRRSSASRSAEPMCPRCSSSTATS